MNLKPLIIVLISTLIINIIYNGIYITMFKDATPSDISKDKVTIHFKQYHITTSISPASAVSPEQSPGQLTSINSEVSVETEQLIRKRKEEEEVAKAAVSVDVVSKNVKGVFNFSDEKELKNSDESRGKSSNGSREDKVVGEQKEIKEKEKEEKKKEDDLKNENKNIIDDYGTEKMIKKKDERRKDGREYLIHKGLIKHENLAIEYSQGLNTREIGPICSSSLGMKKYRCDSPNEYCDKPKCVHSSVFQLIPGKSEVTATDFTRFLEHRSHYFNGMEERLEHVSQLLDEYHKELGIEKFSRPMFLMFINFGYIYQFFNWLCSCEKNGIENIRKEIIVLTTDDLAQNVLKSLGIYTINVRDSGAWMRNTNYDVLPSKRFGLGIHAKINTQSIALLTDMIQLGYDVFLMDADLVWKKDPRPEMIKLAQEKDYDGLFLSDGRRWDHSFDSGKILPQFRKLNEFDHPYLTHNTGFYLIRSSPSMKEFTASVMQGLHLIMWKGTDQMWWNTLIFHRKFSHLKFGVMPTKTYIPGSNISTGGNLKDPVAPFPKDDYVVAHMSDTNSHLKKITKFYLTGQWYLTEECPFFQVCIDAKETKASMNGCLPDNYQEFYDKNAVSPPARR